MATKPVFDDVKPWPGENPASAPAPRDHNRPPPEEVIPAEFREALISERADFLTLLDQLLGKGDPDSEDYVQGSVDRAKCADETTLGLCGELVKRLRACEQLVSKVHQDVKAPYLLAGRLCDAEKNALHGRIIAGKSRIEALQQDYLREQRRKEQLAEAERQAEFRRQEAERQRLAELARENNIDPVVIPEAAPPPPPVQRAEPVRSDGGATVSRLTEWKSQVEDYRLAFTSVKDDAKVREAIDAAVQRLVKATKGQKPMKGVRIYEDVKASNR
jgi:hypothetical protein